MKWGCLFKQFAIIVIIAAVLHYVFAEKAEKWFWNPIKNMVYNEIELQIDSVVDSITYVAPNKMKEALISYMYSIAENEDLKNAFESDMLSAGKLQEIISQYSLDSIITEDELHKIKDEFQESLKNEK